ncbi:hypothetical protein A1O7_01738 [Cladophialophora yegresii CBS 114405]|uniref:Uncharacterized protein n=1 Tax=Cladophialophora yegresii CBS 114405 TaxID=1182544 RepID=W9WBC5_9EURO|nr:uncharacterized protein A1O7_01738 [Cladophialophora yegresii CBS 114405]EXJ65397.1 hypothetical protein A1O7_01738 [Cladophialophora yegresii CBS 114405]
MPPPVGTRSTGLTRGLSSDTIASFVIGATSTIWTLAVVRHALDHQYCASLPILAELAKAPLLTQVLFGFWTVRWLDGLRAEKSRGRGKPHFWSLVNLRGPFAWSSGVQRGFYRSLISCVSIAVAVPALACIIASEEPVDGILALGGLLMFLLDGTANIPYVSAQHRYADDGLRVALPTTNHEGTVYVLQSKDMGIDAVWSPKVENEYLAADNEVMVLFQHMRSGRWAMSEPLVRLRKTLAMYQEWMVLSTAQLERLAAWI